MPHIRLKNPKIQNLINSDQVFFSGTNEHNETIICLEKENIKFSLLLRPKNDVWLLKYDKSTRPSDTRLLKNALQEVAKILDAEIVFDNTSATKEFSLSGLLYADSFNADEFINTPLFIEIGFGSGKHLQNLATNNQQAKFIGIEIYKPAIKQFLNRCFIEKVHNVYAIDEDARVFLETMPNNFLDGIYVHFPVPWQDAPHRRVWSKGFLQEVFRVLKPNGFINLRTDEKDYFEYAKNIADSFNAKSEFSVNMPLDVTSKYEARWIRQNKDRYDFTVFKTENIKCDTIAYNFDFAKCIDTNKKIVRDGVVVAVKTTYSGQGDTKLIKVTMGSVDKPKVYFVYEQNNSACYWPKMPLYTHSNQIAHQILKD